MTQGTRPSGLTDQLCENDQKLISPMAIHTTPADPVRNTSVRQNYPPSPDEAGSVPSSRELMAYHVSAAWRDQRFVLNQQDQHRPRCTQSSPRGWRANVVRSRSMYKIVQD